MEIHETHIAVHSDENRYGLGESMGWEATGTKTFGEEYRRIMREGIYDPEVGMMASPRCTGRMYRDNRDGSARRVGWVFVFRTGKGKDSYLREVWISVRPE